MKKNNFKITFSFMSDTKSTLGLDYTKGTIIDVDGERKKYQELILGFLFFFIGFCITK